MIGVGVNVAAGEESSALPAELHQHITSLGSMAAAVHLLVTAELLQPA